MQPAIAALHDAATSTATTDWPQIVELYSRLEDNPMAALSQAIALAMAKGPAAGLQRLTVLDNDPRLAGTHRLEAARAHLL